MKTLIFLIAIGVIIYIISFYHKKNKAFCLYKVELGAYDKVDWKYFCTDTDGNDNFYDTQSISRGQDTIKVRLKTILKDKGREAWITNFPFVPGIKNISFIAEIWEIDCSKNMSRRIAERWYDSKGGVISSMDEPTSQFSRFGEFLPYGVEDRLVEILCEGAKRKINEKGVRFSFDS